MNSVECVRRTLADMGRSKYGHPAGLWLYSDERGISRDLDARLGRTSKFLSFLPVLIYVAQSLSEFLNY